MSDWQNDQPANGTSTWDTDQPIQEAPKPKPDPVVKPSKPFLMRFLSGETQTGKDLAGLRDAFKFGYGDQPYISWRPEDLQALQEWGIINKPGTTGLTFPNLVRQSTEVGLKGLTAIPDTILRGINGLAAVAAEETGQLAGSIAEAIPADSQETAAKRGKAVHDTVAGMSWEAIQTWFLYEMSNGAGFGRVKTEPLSGTETIEPVGTLPKQSQFDGVAELIGSKTLEPNVKKAFEQQGITPAEIFNDAQTNVTITQDLVSSAPKIKAYEPAVKPISEWVSDNMHDILTSTPKEFNAKVKSAGMDRNDVINYIASQPEISGKWTEALNDIAVEKRVRELQPQVSELYDHYEGKKLEASNKVEELKAAKEEAKYGVIDKLIEETQARLKAEGGQGKRYKVYQKRLDDLKEKRKEMELTNENGEVMDDYNRNIQAARMEWLDYDQKQRTLVPVLGKARKQAQAELDAIQPADIPLTKEEARAAEAASRSEPVSKPLEAETGKSITINTYHGTKGEFEELDIKHSGNNTSAGSTNSGAIFMTTDPAEAAKYAEGTAGGGNVRLLKTNLKNPLVIDFSESQITDVIKQDGLVEKYIAQAKTAGHDGLILKSINNAHGNNMVVAFNNRSVTHRNAGGAGQPPAGGNAGAAGGAAQPPSFNTAYQNVLSTINIGGKSPKRKLTWNGFYTRFLDQFNPVRVAVRDALKAVGIDYRTIKNTAADPYIHFRLTKGAFGKVNSFLNYGTRNYHTLQVNGYSLKEILKPIAHDLEGLTVYVKARRAIELEGRGIQSGVDLADAQVVVNAGQARYEAIHRDLVDFQNRITEYLKDSGIISEDTYANMVTANQEYIPYYRYFEDQDPSIGKNVSNRLGAKNPIKAIEGSDLATIDPLESVIRNTYAYIALADKNAAGLKLVDLMNQLGHLQQVPIAQTQGLSQISQVMRRARGDNMIAVWRDGKPELYKVVNNPELVEAWQGLDQYVASDIVRFLSIPAKTLRAGATLTPDFMARNFIRDMATAFVTASGHPINSAEGFFHAFFRTKTYYDWQASGGSNAAMISLDRTYLQNNIRQLLSDTGMLQRVWNSVNHPVESLRATSELFENATRLGVFINKTRRTGRGTKAALLEGGFKSREATIDFARMGTQIRAVNMLDAFLNANLQGTDRIIRAFKDDPIGTGARVAAGITLPSLYLWMANHNDPRYKNAHDYEKNLYWLVYTDDWQPISQADAKKQNIPPYLLRTQNGRLEVQKGYTFKFPKPFELGIVFGSLPERMLDEWYDRDPKALEGWSNDSLSAMIPQLLPQVLGVPVEGITNHSFFTGQPVVPDYLTGLIPEYQYTEYTSETAKLLGKMFGALPGIKDAKVNPNAPLNGLAKQITSPMILENYVQGWFGGLGKEALKIADAGLAMAGVGADKIKPATPLEENPFIKSFMIRTPEANPQVLTDFRTHNDANNMIMNTMKSLIKAGDQQGYKDLQKEYGLRATLNNTQKAIAQQYALIHTIYNTGSNPKTGKPIYTQNDKRQLIDSIYYTIWQMADQGNKILIQEDELLKKYKAK